MNYITSLVSFQTASRISGRTMIVRARWLSSALVGLVLAQFIVSGALAAPADDFKDASKLVQRGEGDQKTPLGVYRITSKVAKEKLTDFYGPGAFPINIPNDIDKRLGRTGSGIWIHGTPSDTDSRPPLASDGCVVLTNEDFQPLGKYVDPGMAPVGIAPSVDWQCPADWCAFRSTFNGCLPEWKHDWESRNMHPYLSHYSRSFAADGKDIADWSSTKRRVNAAKMFVKLDR